jgi:hypothetical protein
MQKDLSLGSVYFLKNLCVCAATVPVHGVVASRIELWYVSLSPRVIDLTWRSKTKLSRILGSLSGCHAFEARVVDIQEKPRVRICGNVCFESGIFSAAEKASGAD